MDAAKAPEHPKASATEIFAMAATQNKAWSCAPLCASWFVKRRHSPGMLCNVAGKAGPVLIRAQDASPKDADVRLSVSERRLGLVQRVGHFEAW
jgi:hypothetical protein